MALGWPLQMLTTFTFEDVGGMTQGWTGTLHQLETHLAMA